MNRQEVLAVLRSFSSSQCRHLICKELNECALVSAFSRRRSPGQRAHDLISISDSLEVMSTSMSHCELAAGSRLLAPAFHSLEGKSGPVPVGPAGCSQSQGLPSLSAPQSPAVHTYNKDLSSRLIEARGDRGGVSPPSTLCGSAVPRISNLTRALNNRNRGSAVGMHLPITNRVGVVFVNRPVSTNSSF